MRSFLFFLFLLPFVLVPMLLFVAKKNPPALVFGVSLVATVLLFWISRLNFVAQLSNGMWYAAGIFSVLGYIAFGLLGAAAVIANGIDRHLKIGSKMCWQPDYFSDTKICEGRNHSFLQGRQYYYRSSGTPKPGICGQFAEKARGTKGRCFDLEGYQRVACKSMHLADYDFCYSCQRLAGTGDTYQTLFAFDADCKKAAGYDTVNVELQEVPEYIRKAASLPDR